MPNHRVMADHFRSFSLRSTVAAMLACAVLTLPASAVAESELDAEMREMEKIETFLDVMQSFYEIVGSMHSISSDPEQRVIFFMHQIKEAYEDRGEEIRAADVLRGVIKDSANPTVRAAAYFMLGDLLKDHDQIDAAIETLEKGLAESLDSSQ